VRRSPHSLVWLNRISAAVFVVLAARLLLVP
jgi:threonine/homoserine/homoserine lactone efflux protein